MRKRCCFTRLGQVTLASLSNALRAACHAAADRTISRPFMRHDAIVIGGSFAGLAAALYIARARRSVCIIDTGLPRNRFAEHSHGFLTHDGSAPRAMLATARSQVAALPDGQVR
jgi:hypothetical protein